MPGALGLRRPLDQEHIEKYALAALPAAEQPKIVPVTFACNWYTAMDSPVKVGSGYFIAPRGESLGSIRGGHCFCLKPPSIEDLTAWWTYYNQGPEGACTGFGSSRMMSLLNRKRYDAFWLYHEAQLVDEFPDTPPGEGSTARAAMSVLKAKGHKTVRASSEYGPYLREGIAAYRWATTWAEVRKVLGIPDSQGYVPLVNSWGRDYPHIVNIPDAVGERLLAEEGEAALVTDR